MHTRKAAVFYWSLGELGITALQCEECWCTIGLGRMTALKDAKDCVSQLTVRCARELQTSFGRGVKLDFVSGRSATIWGRLRVLVGDEPALKEMIGNKGHAGTRPCPLCLNCTADYTNDGRDGLWADDVSGSLVSAAETDFARFRLVD